MVFIQVAGLMSRVQECRLQSVVGLWQNKNFGWFGECCVFKETNEICCL